ncbi:MAG: hypothetical protein HS114_18820 [Anaerolineales bacterium]|nr:hypothetical protein [Anaerolineales bacterium]
MIPLTPEQRDYKERTLNQLMVNLPLLEAKLARETQRQVAVTLHEHLEAIEAHIVRLQQELTHEVLLEPVADDLCRQAASALTKQKLFMAKRYIAKLEAIEPFYPEISRLKQEAETGQVSRRTRALSQSEPLPTAAAANIPLLTAGGAPSPAAPNGPRAALPSGGRLRQKEATGWRQYFQFHIVASCLVIMLLACVMAGVGGMNVLRWLIEGS